MCLTVPEAKESIMEGGMAGSSRHGGQSKKLKAPICKHKLKAERMSWKCLRLFILKPIPRAIFSPVRMLTINIIVLSRHQVVKTQEATRDFSHTNHLT